MSDLLEKCSVCQALLDEEDLFCANCGTEAPNRALTGNQAGLQSTYNFDCSGCGASMSYDPRVKNLRCPFCGSERLEAKPDAKMLSPKRILPFRVQRAEAEQIMRRWLGNGFWRPRDLASTASIETMAAVFVPYWVFSAKTLTYWTADSDQVPAGARGNWAPAFGSHQGEYNGLLIGASGALTPHETNAICPFDLSLAIPAEQVDLQNAVYEQFRVQRKYARPLAQQGLEELEQQACQSLVPGRSRNLKVNVRLEGLVSEPILLPVWIMAYRYQDHVYRFLINGSSGRATGTAPSSWKKIVLVAAIAIGAVVTAMIVIGACAGVMR